MAINLPERVVMMRKSCSVFTSQMERGRRMHVELEDIGCCYRIVDSVGFFVPKPTLCIGLYDHEDTA